MRKFIALIAVIAVIIAIGFFIKKKAFPRDLPISYNQVDSVQLKNATQVFTTHEVIVLKDSSEIFEFIRLLNEFSTEIVPPDPKINRGVLIIEVFSDNKLRNEARFVYFDRHSPVLYFSLGRAFTNPSLNEYFKGIF